ncbi:MAG TPA: tetratricopeptide repeat protein [Bryobacteraceae bacterium]|jgi:tol-pal system protein YbgF
MRYRGIITAFFLLLPAASQAASKETQEMQRDIALLQDDVRQLQRSFDKQMATQQTLTQQTLDAATRTATSMGVLERTLNESIKGQLQSGFAPVAGLGVKVDQVSSQVQTLSDAIQALNASMQQLHAQLNDLNNVVKAMQPPAAPPPAPTDSGVPGGPTAATGPGPANPPVPAEVLYQNALRDMNGGKPDLALVEYRDFIKYYPTSDLAANCQFYIGMIHYSRNEFEDAVKDFDSVLEQYPKGPKTASAFYYKGVSLVKMGRSRDARKEFTSVITNYPRTEEADKARAQLKVLGFNPPAKGKK